MKKFTCMVSHRVIVEGRELEPSNHLFVDYRFCNVQVLMVFKTIGRYITND